MSRLQIPFENRMWKFIHKRGECWEWTGNKYPNGYGQTKLSGSKVPTGAHRAVYKTLIGDIPKGMHLDHLCSNKSCVNPAHLEIVSPAENTRRWAASIEICPSGHERKQNWVERKNRGDGYCRACRTEYQRHYRARITP